MVTGYTCTLWNNTLTELIHTSPHIHIFPPSVRTLSSILKANFNCTYSIINYSQHILIRSSDIFHLIAEGWYLLPTYPHLPHPGNHVPLCFYDFDFFFQVLHSQTISLNKTNLSLNSIILPFISFYLEIPKFLLSLSPHLAPVFLKPCAYFLLGPVNSRYVVQSLQGKEVCTATFLQGLSWHFRIHNFIPRDEQNDSS